VGDKGSEICKKGGEAENSFISPMSFNFKIEFPQFDGRNPMGWVKKCSKYFNLYRTPSHQKIELASLYMIGQAEMWYNSYALGRQNVLWEDFMVDVCARFRDELAVVLWRSSTN